MFTVVCHDILVTASKESEESPSDSFDAVTNINNIPRHLFQEGYQFISFDVEALFTNVPLRQTVDIILDRIYKDELITTTFKKCTIKKTYFRLL